MGAYRVTLDIFPLYADIAAGMAGSSRGHYSGAAYTHRGSPGSSADDCLPWPAGSLTSDLFF